MAAVSQPKLNTPDRHTINVTDLRTETREILENAHFRGWHYIVQRAGQPMVAILDHEEYDRLLTLASTADSAIKTKDRAGGKSG